MFWEGIDKIILRQARKNLGVNVVSSKFSDIKSNTTKQLSKKSFIDLSNEKLELEMIIFNTELHNIDNFISVRFAFYALGIAVVALITDFDFKPYLNFIFGVLSLILISFRYVSDLQKDRMLYYKFKLSCINEVIESITRYSKRNGKKLKETS